MPSFAADLHLHSQCSDGTWTPSELVARAHAAGLDLMALTDHDTTQGTREAAAAARSLGVRFLSGVEISTTLNGEWFHMLGLGVNPEHPTLANICAHNTKANLENSAAFVASVAPRLGFDMAAFEGHVRNPSNGGWKALDFLIAQGFCRDVNDFFARFIKEHGHPAFPVFPHPAEAVAAIHAAGGRAVLAHPNYDRRSLSLPEILAAFHSFGIDGVECFHPRHDEPTARFCKGWALERGLLVTGGSDCHGTFVGGRSLGQPILTEKDLSLDALLALLAGEGEH